MFKINSQKVILARANAGLTEKELAKLSKVGVNTISKIENCHSQPKASTIGKIAKALNVKLEDLILMQESGK